MMTREMVCVAALAGAVLSGCASDSEEAPQKAPGVTRISCSLTLAVSHFS